MDAHQQARKPSSTLSSLILAAVLAVPVGCFQSPLYAAEPPQQAGAVPLQQGIQDLAAKLAKGIPEGHTMTVAVTDFPDSIRNQTCGLGRFVAERLTTLLSQHPQCRLIERRRLEMVLNELKFGLSELVDPAKARKLGAMLGVQGLVVGSVSDLGGTVDVDARIIDIQTNVSLPGASASIIQDDMVKRLIADCVQATTKPTERGPSLSTPSAPPSGQKAPAQTPVQKVVAEGFTFELKSCSLSGTTVTCAFLVTNGGEDSDLTIDVGNSNARSRIIDDSGNEYPATDVQLANRRMGSWGGSGYVQALLVSGVPTRANLTFEKVSGTAGSISLLEILCEGRRGGHFTAQLRKVALVK